MTKKKYIIIGLGRCSICEDIQAIKELQLLENVLIKLSQVCIIEGCKGHIIELDNYYLPF